MHADRQEALRALVMFALGMLAVLVVLICLMSKSQARFSPAYASLPANVRSWYATQPNAKGQWCCDEGDGHSFYGAYTLNADGSVTIIAADGIHVLPSYMLLKGSNPTGHAVWWYIVVDGVHTDYCFAPGPMI